MARTDSLAFPEHLFHSDEDGVRSLHFGSPYVQGAMRLKQPTELVLQYTQEMMAWLLFCRPQEIARIAIVGLGAGALLRYCLRHTTAELDVIEYNPQVITYTQQYFKVPTTHPRIRFIHADAQHYLADCPATYDVLLVDVYDADAQGPTCSSLAFYRACHDVLSEQGVMTVNLFANHRSFGKNLRHIDKAFHEQCYALPETPDGNCIVVAGKAMRFSPLHAQQIERQFSFPASTWLQELHDSRVDAPPMLKTRL